MKKFLKLMMIFMLVLIPVTFADAKTKKTKTTKKSEPVNMYVFYGDGCPHCAELEEYIKTNLKNNDELKDKVKVIYYEVWYDSTNSDFMQKVAAHFSVEANGVPFFVVGDKYFSGYGENMNTEIETAIKTAYNDAKYTDEVMAVAKKENVTPNESNPEEKKDFEETEENTKGNNDTLGWIILGVTAVVVVLIIFSRGKSDDSSDEETEENDDEDFEDEELDDTENDLEENDDKKSDEDKKETEETKKEEIKVSKTTKKDNMKSTSTKKSKKNTKKSK